MDRYPDVSSGSQDTGTDAAAWDSTLLRAALEALPFGILIVDERLAAVHANPAAARILGAGAGLRLHRRGSMAGAEVNLIATSEAEMVRLTNRVRLAALHGSGGGLCFSGQDTADRPARRLAVLVIPLPRHLSDGPRETPGHALLLLRDITSAPPPETLLAEMFGLTASEAQVAALLAGGATAEQVALQRGVRAVTVRGQIRVIMGKMNVSSLRAFERLLGSLPAPAEG
ncbi:helix-turn-helix transcriptional regulator [Muricoccus radiodurans]|uniref:helix-turn-helix transcriptional regulator n=1 Tax=Muricoccus radiodurans TaxID=2231721 RepID=UPI003CEC0BDB